jgi:hypothetical protein
MWELTSKKPPFSHWYHDVELALKILDGTRPEIIKGTPDFYANIMKQCWNSDPLKRPNASLLPKLFEEMSQLCKVIDDNCNSSQITLFSSLHQNKYNSVDTGLSVQSKSEKHPLGILLNIYMYSNVSKF